FPFVGILNNLYSIPLLGNFLLQYSDSRYLPHPEEISKKYISLMKNYGSLNHQDVTEKDSLKLKSVIEKQLFYQKKNMIIADCGRPARLLYYEKIFPGTKFIHVVRDGRDVVFESLRDRPQWFTDEKDLKDFYPNAPQRLVKLANQYKNT